MGVGRVRWAVLSPCKTESEVNGDLHGISDHLTIGLRPHMRIACVSHLTTLAIHLGGSLLPAMTP